MKIAKMKNSIKPESLGGFFIKPIQAKPTMRNKICKKAAN
jgi:hypothetical protein